MTRIGAASQGTMNNVLAGGDGWVFYETLGGGQGGRPTRTGMSGVHANMTNTAGETLHNAGMAGENWLLRGGDDAHPERLLDKCTIALQAGDVLRILTPGGRGWGAAPGRISSAHVAVRGLDDGRWNRAERAQ